MHAATIVSGFIETHLGAIHAGRRRVLSALVGAVMCGQCLSLTRLSRAVQGSGRLKASIKRVERMIGNARIKQETHIVGRQLLQWLCRVREPLIIAVDWSALNPGGTLVELRAAVTRLGMGRALTVYQQVYPLAKLGNAKAEREMLETLRCWIAEDIQVIVVSDAGFRRPWFAQVERCGWSWIGRVRRGVNVSHDDSVWVSAEHWFEQATSKARRLTNCYMSKRQPWLCDMVVYKAHSRKRKLYRRPGHGSTSKAIKEARARAHEPWLLAHSGELKAYRPDEIVAMYERRMHIEECFRDTKSAVYGMGLEIARSRLQMRLQALLLIATLAAFLLWHIGQMAEAEGLQRRFKATTRVGRELSVITLAVLLCAQNQITLSDQAQLALAQRLGIRL